MILALCGVDRPICAGRHTSCDPQAYLDVENDPDRLLSRVSGRMIGMDVTPGFDGGAVAIDTWVNRRPEPPESAGEGVLSVINGGNPPISCERRHEIGEMFRSRFGSNDEDRRSAAK